MGRPVSLDVSPIARTDAACALLLYRSTDHTMHRSYNASAFASGALPPLSFDETYQLLLQLPLPPCLFQILEAPQIVNDVACLAKIDFLQKVPHFDFHLFNHAARVRDVRIGVLQGVILLSLSAHTSEAG